MPWPDPGPVVGWLDFILIVSIPALLMTWAGYVIVAVRGWWGNRRM